MGRQVYTCECGMKTTEPFYVGGRLLCTICAEKENPHVVRTRAVLNWKEFTRGNHKVPTQSHARNWEKLDVDG